MGFSPTEEINTLEALSDAAQKTIMKSEIERGPETILNGQNPALSAFKKPNRPL